MQQAGSGPQGACLGGDLSAVGLSEGGLPLDDLDLAFLAAETPTAAEAGTADVSLSLAASGSDTSGNLQAQGLAPEGSWPSIMGAADVPLALDASWFGLDPTGGAAIDATAPGAMPVLPMVMPGLPPAPFAAPMPPPPAAAAPAALTAEEKLEKARAANRAKQARFRARQKERKEDMAQKMEAAQADLEREQQHNASIRLTTNLLEGMREQKDMAIGMLQAASAGQAGTRQQNGAAAAALPQLDGAAASGSGAAEAGITGGEECCAAFWRLPFAERVRQCCALFSSTEPVLQILGAERVDAFALNTTVKRQLGAKMVEAHPFMVDIVLAMTEDDVLRDWAECGEYMAEVVAKVDAGLLTEEQAEDELGPATLYEAILHILMLGYKPEHEHHLLQHCRMPGESEEEEAARWRQVAVDMRVDPERGALLLPAYQAYCAGLDRLGEEAASGLATLQEVQQSLSKQLESLGDSSLSSLVQQYLSLCESAGKLSSQPTSALLLMEDFYAAAGKAVTPMNKARMTAACRPLHPDVPAIVREGLITFGFLNPDGSPAVPAPGASPAGSGAAGG